MIGKILLAVDDFSAALKAARLAIDLAAATRAQLRVLHTVEDHVLTDAVGRVSTARDVARRRQVAGENVLRKVAQLAGEAGVPAHTTLKGGVPARCLLAEARIWQADLVVVGLAAGASGDAHPGEAAIVECADQPVLIVPDRARRAVRSG
ncbi:universal stress protein [Nonomuraea harbinensis]|uniref:Universal stress protein n=1 Tax=Nonomuraea harbinensis TaxID=1286938 RepID=A0ABW1C7X0_9ACTN|nr:universal stress protein [Nonomuraea harbinensis]